ncbi:hypothetical protein ABB37_07650 [Leptomonas pyrrhocoris]|uniref:Transmembrane protein n=1 Tax=Leptomonas pyrrhocoris TaxID=157538 RepID=A0A0N1J4I7_LEPPY|nr:hypothetical protein ABB37_07650 [Leptomonas pyrrhocoris]KPA76852.1 hypothetical protein ABB37_07650 [Leptomonas pyrrhocoris]|eukprot:XP_015655291.1 hypothetical protein ABB37_07650 [Leptomonas pyrrhocoris]
MRKAECTPRNSPGEQRETVSSKLGDSMDSDADVEVHFGPARNSRRSKVCSPNGSRNATENACTDDNLDLRVTTAATAPRFLSFLFPHSSWVAQAFLSALSEDGMALMTACILFLISFAGFVTMNFIAPSRTTRIASQLNAMFTGDDEERQRMWLGGVMPEVVVLLQAGLRVMLVPALAISASGVYVLGNADRRRPGCWLAGYGCAAVILGLALLYLLLRVVLGSQLSGLEGNINASLYEVWNALREDGVPCQWERAFPCSGFHWCCVTNTSALEDEEEDLAASAAWASLCFVTLPSGAAVTQDGTDVTEAVRAQCGVLRTPEGVDPEEVLARTSACALSAVRTTLTATATSSDAKLESCENYILGHLTSTIGFGLCLALGMSVCSLVSGVVATVANLQRIRTSDFVLVNDPAAAAGERAMAAKEKH